MRLGLALPHYDTSLAGDPAGWDGLREVAVTAERSGFSSLWVSDHLFLDWGKYGGPDDQQGAFECWTTLSALAAVTSRIRLGSLTLCNDFRNPALLAKMAATLDLISGGRLDLGLGAGWYEPEYEAAGLVFDPPGRRIARLGESLEVVGRLLQGEVVTYSGRYVSIEGALCRPRPRQAPRPPLWVGGKGDFLLKTALRGADGWNFSWLGDLAAYKERLDSAQGISEEVGRDFNSLRRSVGVYLLAGKDEADARRRFERLGRVTPDGVLSTGSAAGAVSWDEFKRTRFAGTTQEVIDRLGEIRELGVEEVIVTLGTLPFQVSDLEDVELVGTEIAPALA